MTDLQIKKLISNHLKSMHDQGFATALRMTLFSGQEIDWQYAWRMMQSYMPEYEPKED